MRNCCLTNEQQVEVIQASAASYPPPQPNPLSQQSPSSMSKHRLIYWSLHMYLWLQVGREPHEQVVRRQLWRCSSHANVLSQGREAVEGQMGMDEAGSQRGWALNGQLRKACRESPLFHVGSLLSPPRSCIATSPAILGKEKPCDYPRDRRHGQDHSSPITGSQLARHPGSGHLSASASSL